jgi:hypothetical protein
MYPIKTAITLAIIDGRYQFSCERCNCQSSLTHLSSCPDVYEQCMQSIIYNIVSVKSEERD